MSANRLISISQVSEMTGFSISTIRNLVRGAYMLHGKWIAREPEHPFPRPIRIGKQNRFREREVERWLKAVGA